MSSSFVVKEIVRAWERLEAGQVTEKQVTVRLSISNFEFIERLVDMYPKKNRTEIIDDLVTIGLDFVERELKRKSP